MTLSDAPDLWLDHGPEPDDDGPDDPGPDDLDDRAEWLAPPVTAGPLPADVVRVAEDDEWDGFVHDVRAAGGRMPMSFADEAAETARAIRAHVAAHHGPVER